MTRPTHMPLDDVLKDFLKLEWGFTGTRAGMKVAQLMRVQTILKRGKPHIVRHGCAFGADTEFHAVWREHSNQFADVWPASEDRAALFRDQQNVFVQPVMPPLMRNEEIVKRDALLIAAPHTSREELRSGTWTTIRCARNLNRPIIILWPSGLMTYDADRFLSRITLP